MRMHLRIRMDTPAFGSTHYEMRRVLLDAIERIPVARHAMAGYYILRDNDRREVGDVVVHAVDGRDPLVLMAESQALEKIAKAAREIDAAMLNPAAINRGALANLARGILAEINEAKRRG